MKNKLTLQQKLEKRKAKQPNGFLFWLYHFIEHNFLIKKYNTTYNFIDKVSDCKGPCFLIWNHLSRLDHLWVMESVFPKKYNMLAGYNEFFRSHLHFPFKIMNVIPKKIYNTDINSLKAMSKIISKGGCVAFSPEGMSSIYGHNQPIVATTGHFLKHFNIPVYLMTLRGAYLTEHKVCLDERYGKVECETKLLFSPEQLKAMTDEEVDDKINEAFRHDDYAWNKTARVKWKRMENVCSHYEDICYRCPRCGAELQMHAEGNRIECKACGNGAVMNEYYDFVPFDDKCVIPESPSKWVDWERTVIIKEIRENPNYSHTEKVQVGYLPPYKYVSDKKTSEPCGEGEITFDHSGIHFKGVKLGKEWKFDLSYKEVFSLIHVTDVTFFALYVKGQYFEFKPSRPIAGKLLLITEEMHRLHVNLWKNFPWDAYMYEGTELDPALTAAKETDTKETEKQ